MPMRELCNPHGFCWATAFTDYHFIFHRMSFLVHRPTRGSPFAVCKWLFNLRFPILLRLTPSFLVPISFLCTHIFVILPQPVAAMSYVPHAPRQAVLPPIPSGNTNADLDLGSVIFNDNELFSFNDIFSSEFSPLLSIPPSDHFFPFYDHYTLESPRFHVPAPQGSISRTNATEGGYHLPQRATALTLPDDQFGIAPLHAEIVLEQQQSPQGLEPNCHTKTKSKENTGEDNSNSPDSTNSPGSNSSRESQKRTLEDMMQTFPTIPDNQVTEKKRKNYDPKTRKKVALMRKIKPCKRCVIHRIAVRPAVPPSVVDVLMLVV
jgi:hypothetical protein